MTHRLAGVALATIIALATAAPVLAEPNAAPR